MPNPGLVDHILRTYTGIVDRSWPGLTNDVLWLLGHLSTWYLLLIVAPLMVAGLHLALPLMLKAWTKVMLVTWLVTHFQMVTKLFVDWVIAVGLFAGGNRMTVDEFLLPGLVLAQGMQISLPLISYLENLGTWGRITNLGVATIFQGATAFHILAFFIITAHITVIVITFKVACILGLLFVGFLIFRPTAFMAEHVLHDIFRMALRLAALALVTSVMNHLFLLLAFPDGQTPTHWSAISSAVGAGLFAIISWVVPSYVSAHGGAIISAMSGAMFGAASGVRGALRI